MNSKGERDKTYDLDDGGSTDSLANTAELELRGGLDGHDLVSLQEMEGHVCNVGS